jgi:hypothetical protein
MEHFVANQDEALEVIATYLERLGVEGMRQPYAPDQINRSAVIRYLINEKLVEVLANPPASEGERHRVGQATKKSQVLAITDGQLPNLRKGRRS